MDDKEFLILSKKIQGIFKGLRNALGLGSVGFYMDIIRESEHDCDGSTGVVASIHPSWQYGRAHLRVYAAAILEGNLDDDEIAEAIVHEFVHYWIHPISRYGESKEYDLIEEKLCTEVARGIRKGMEAAGEEVADHYRLEIKRLKKELKRLQPVEERGA
jgi:hypothetical protein